MKDDAAAPPPPSGSPGEPASASASGSAAKTRARAERLVAIGGVILAAMLAFHGLGNHPLWSDEANTALFARNFLKFGELTAWDGANLIGSPVIDEFDETLINTYLPPQQYYAAALGIGVFGESPFGARAPFAVAGIASILLAAWWARRYFDGAFPAFLPVFLLGLSPAWLLFIRNCRYYSLGAFWTILLFAIWTAMAGDPEARARPSWRSDRARTVAIHFAGVVAVLGLFTSQYIGAVAALGALPVFFLDRRFRSRRQLHLLATLSLAGLCGIVWVLVHGVAGESLVERHASVTGWARNAVMLAWWHVRDAGFFEFFAWPLVLPLALPWMHAKLAALRPLAARGWILVLVFGALILLVAACSPQKCSDTAVANMRYAVPLIAVGAMVGSAGVFILWKTHRLVAVAVAAILIGTNALHLGSHRGQIRHDYYGAFPVRSTLLDYVRGNLDPAPSTARTILDVLGKHPAGTTVWTSPFGLSTTAMFSLPRLHYCGQVRSTDAIRSDLAAGLPEYVLWSAPLPDVIVVVATKIDLHESGAIDIKLADRFLKERITQMIGTNRYRGRELIPVHGIDETRPEIPGRLFWKPREGTGHALVAWVLEKERR